MTSLSWQQLFAKLRPIVSSSGSASIHKHTIISLLDRYNSQEVDFRAYLFYDKSGYTKNLVEQFGDECNVIVMCWAPGQSSAFHGHEGSKCFVKVLSGELLEQQVPYPSDELARDSFEPKETLLKRDTVAYIDDSIGLHKVINRSLENPAVTLHIYTPPYVKCRVFDSERVGKDNNKIRAPLSRSKAFDVTFHSKIGVLQSELNCH